MTLARTRGLGRGLASLIPDSAFDADDNASDRPNLRMVPLDEVRPNPVQPREVFETAELDSLAASIRQHGILSPLIVRKERGHYVLIAGERRLRAAALAGVREVPVIVREAEEPGVQLELALVENLQRADLDPIEAAKGYARLIDAYGYTQDEVAQRVGKERSTVANALRLLKLPEFVLEALREGQISAGHARALLPIEDRETLRRLLARVVGEQLSVRATERLVAQSMKSQAARAAMPAAPIAYEPLVRMLTDTLQTRVAIRGRSDGGGAILIDFSGQQDLDRLIEQIRGS